MKKNLTIKFIRLKTLVGGNREKKGFEWSIGKTVEERNNITEPSKSCRRILAELEFAIHLSEEKNGYYDEIIESVLDFLGEGIQQEEVLTKERCEKAETMLMPLSEEAKSYKVILAAHAHIDMNWMWSFNETVNITLSTFRTMLNIMNEYPEFCFSQSQASVYKIVEEYDSEMMEEIKKRIEEGRWEVTATAWVETDKNMPSGESLLRHIEYSREYLKNVWGAKRLEVDFSPDTFGHSANVPEINAYSGVKYYYHCRGNEKEQVLYRYRAKSGKEILVHREHHWYNSGITPHIGTSVMKVSKLSGGLKTALMVYGVGDHGGGPTRRDVEHALEMMSWKIFPSIKFGTFHEYFDEAQKVWDKLPVVSEEMNFIFQGCYTTQSRIKKGNRHMEAALMDAEHMAVLASDWTDFSYAKKQMEKAWQNVLFTHFHDILTGSCVQDSREYAMSLYQKSAAVTTTQIQKAMQYIGTTVDTSSILTNMDAYNSQSEGAGVGFGIESFSDVSTTERGSGKTRIFHVFNTLTFDRKENLELTIWDWNGELECIQVKDWNENVLNFQILSSKQEEYWGHMYFKMLVEVKVPAMGYTTIVLSEIQKEEYPVWFNTCDRIGIEFNDCILENENIRICIDKKTGQISSLRDKVNDEEIISSQSAGFHFIETENIGMSAWNIGRYFSDVSVNRCEKLEQCCNGELRQSVFAAWKVGNSKIEVCYSLDKQSSVLKIEGKIDWNESGTEQMIPILTYQIPVAYKIQEYMYDIPAGAIKRNAVNNDVPGLRYGMALGKSRNRNVILISDCKYGYRGAENKLSLTLINSAECPDPYPERGIHQLNLWIGVCEKKEKSAEEMATLCNHRLLYQSGSSHKGKLPMENSLFKVETENVAISAIRPCDDGSILIRTYEMSGKKEKVVLIFGKKILQAYIEEPWKNTVSNQVEVAGKKVIFEAEAGAITTVCVKLNE